uniref:BTB domain-containing protein n=1 Tax=Anopheles culicifacies TaxID=139723 RepID=A0A182LVX3_9DIPT
MSKSYEPQIKWRVNEVEDLVASMKERELLTISDGKKRRSLEVFSVVRSDLQRKGIFRTEEQIRKKMNELRKQYFEANRSVPENRYELCEHYDALHDLFTDAQRKLVKRTERSRTRSKRRHSPNDGPDVSTPIQLNASKSHRRSVSGSSVCSSAPSSKHNGYDQNHHPPQPQQQQQQNGGDVLHNGSRRNHSPEQMVPDKFHLKQSSYQPNLNNSLTNLCKNDRYADVMLLVCNDNDSIAIPAHRLVLGTFSPYFANVFEKFTFVPSSPIIYVALPPTVTRAAMQCLLQYMYTGEAIVHSQTLDDVMMCGEFLRISGFSAKKASSMLKNQQGLVSVPLVTVTKTINMDSSLPNDTRRESSTPVLANITTRATPPTPVPVPMTMRPYYDSQSPPRKMARHYEPMQQQTLFQQPEYSLTHQSKRDMQHNLHRAMYQDELLDQQLMQQAQRSQMLPQRQAQFGHQRQLQQYQSQEMSDDLFQPMPTLRQQQHLMMQPVPSSMLQQRQLQQRYHPQQLQPLDMDMGQDLMQPQLQMLQIPRQNQQQMMPTQQRPLHSLQSQSQLQGDMFGSQSLPLSREAQPLQQFAQTQQRQMVQLPQSSSQQQQPQRQRLQSQPLQNNYQPEQQLQDDLPVPEQLEESQELLEPKQRQPPTHLQQSQQALQQRVLPQRTSQSQQELPARQELVESQELLEPEQPQRTLQQQPQVQDDLIEPQELLESQELLAPQKTRQVQQQRQPQQLQRMLQRRLTQQQKMQDEVIKPQELLESQELLEPQKPREPLKRGPPQSELKQQQQQQQQIQRSKQPASQQQPKQQHQERPLPQQKTQTKETVHTNVSEPEPVAKSSKDGVAQPMLNDSTSSDDDDNDDVTEMANGTVKESGEGETQHDKSLDDSVHTKSDSEIEFLEKPRKNSIFQEFPDHRKFDDHEQRKKDFIKEYEEHMKNSQHPMVETPESSPSVPPVSPKSPVVARYRSKSTLPSTIKMQHRKPCSQRRAPSPKPDIIEALDSMVTLTSDESMMEIITKSPESQTSHFSTRSHSPDSQAKINAIIEHMGIPDTDTAIFVNSTMDAQACAELDDDSNDFKEGTPLDQLVSSRLNCQLCHESFTTPPEWVQHVSGHCVMDLGPSKRRRFSVLFLFRPVLWMPTMFDNDSYTYFLVFQNDDDSDNDSGYFRCDMCSSYFILAQDWLNHVANHEAEAHDDV